MLAKRKSIRECKKLWRAIKKSGLPKEDFLSTPEGKKWVDKDYISDCPLCEFSIEDDCDDCPLMVQYGESCFTLGFVKYELCPDFIEKIMGLKE